MYFLEAASVSAYIHKKENNDVGIYDRLLCLLIVAHFKEEIFWRIFTSSE